jgi:Zn-finger nucleic acid-binding protein
MQLTERARPAARLADCRVSPTLAAKTLPRIALGRIRLARSAIDARSRVTAAQSMPGCPLCRCVMQPGTAAGLPVGICPSCAGLWLEPSGLIALQRTLSEDSVAFQRPFVPRDAGPVLTCRACLDGHLGPGTVQSVRALRCDSCRGVFLPAGVPPKPSPTDDASTLGGSDMATELLELLEATLVAFP